MQPQVARAANDISPQQMAQQFDELTRAVRERAHDDSAWLALAEILADPDQRRYALERAVKLNPANARAQDLLAEMQPQMLNFEDRLMTLTSPPTITPAPPVRGSTENALNDRLNRARQRAGHVSTPVREPHPAGDVAVVESAMMATIPMPSAFEPQPPAAPVRASQPERPSLTLQPFNLSDVDDDLDDHNPAMTREALLLLEAVRGNSEPRRHSSLRERVAEALYEEPVAMKAPTRSSPVPDPIRRSALYGSLATTLIAAFVLFASLLSVSPLLR